LQQATAVIDEFHMIEARCASCTGVVVTRTGVTVPLATGNWYLLNETDIVAWIQAGYIFEFKDVADVAYLQEKYNL
jgi:hypothetical protein